VSDITPLAQELVRLGTNCVFGIPGEGPSLLLLDELEKNGCRFHLVSHEAAGALAAGGFGRGAGIPGISLSIKGPGFSNMLSGIASNWLDRNPALSLAESYGPGSSPYRLHKRLDHGAMVTPVVKAYADNVSPQLLPNLWDFCLTEQPGPVHLDISHQMKGTRIDAGSPIDTSNDLILSAVEQRIGQATRPIVIAGALATRRPWRDNLAKLKIPVFTTFAGKGAFDEMLSYAAGVFTNSGGEYSPEKAILCKADLILGLGLRTSEIIEARALPAPLIILDELAGAAKGLEALTELTASAESFVELLEWLGEKEWGASEVAGAKDLIWKKLGVEHWLPAGAFYLTQQRLPESTLFVLDTGNFCTIGEHVLTARRPLQIMGSALARSMGVGIPTAVGVAFAAPGTPVVVVTGDGGMRMYPEIITIAVREKLPILMLLMSDGFFASIRQQASNQGLSQNYLRLDSSCWTRVLEAWGCPGERIESFAALENALTSWRTSPVPLFLELVFDADDYIAMTEGIR
jgi:acetolactate synthase I/II/III large subunit